MRLESSTKQAKFAFLCRFVFCVTLWTIPGASGLGQTPFPSTTPGTLPPTPSYPSSPATAGTTSFPATTLPPVSTAPPVYSVPPPSTYNPYAPTFRPSTAPAPTSTASPTMAPYGAPANSSFNQVYNSWMEWLTGNPTVTGAPTAYGQPTYGTPYGVPAYGQPVGTPATPPGYPPTTYSSPSYPPAYSNPNPGMLFPGTSPSPYSASPYAANPYAASPYAANPYSANPYSTGGYPPNPYPNSWNAWWYNTSTAVQTQTAQTMRLCQGLRFRYTYLPGNTDFGGVDANQIESHDFESSLVFAIPRFFGMSQPWYLMPSYAQHLWSGPSVPGSDLPGSAFSAFLDSTWETDPLQTFGTELGWRVGVFSDFDAISTESIRLQGKALAKLRCTPNSTIRAGVYYIDRNKIKLLPAGGILWMPNQDTRWDIFFPEPKLSHYLTTCGTHDIWWYLTGYYGGGAWTIRHVDDDSHDEIDINDIRVMVGFEKGRNDLLRQGFRTCFFEFGYAFNRELIYRNRPEASLSPDDSLVFRAGFGY